MDLKGMIRRGHADLKFAIWRGICNFTFSIRKNIDLHYINIFSVVLVKTVLRGFFS